MTNKLKTIARINKKSIAFQVVDGFKLIRNEFIPLLGEKEKRGFSDWVGSGDLVKADFSFGVLSNFEFDFEFRELELEFKHRTKFGDYQLATLKKEITFYQRKNNAFLKAVEKTGYSHRSLDMKILLNILFEKLNVIGGTVSLDTEKLSFDRRNTNQAIELVMNNCEDCIVA